MTKIPFIAFVFILFVGHSLYAQDLSSLWTGLLEARIT